jgi:Domain of unknown function (DUF1963)
LSARRSGYPGAMPGIFGRRRRAREELARAVWAAREEAARARDAVADQWLDLGASSPEAIRAHYDARLDTLDDELRPWGRPIAAWALRDGDPAPDGSFVGGAPGLDPTEDWPGVDGDPGRFWAQLNLADLAPYAAAYRIAMPAHGLLQLFLTDGGYEIARHIPVDALAGLELRRDIPVGQEWDDVADAEPYLRHTQRIALYPEALVPWQECSHIMFREGVDAQLECTTSEELPGYSFGWWPFSRPESGEWTFLAVCASRPEMALSYSDEGFLWASVPTAELAAGDFSHLTAEGESS